MIRTEHERARQIAQERREASRGQRAHDAVVRRAPPLVAVLPEDVQLLAGVPHRVADVLEAAQVERLSLQGIR